MVKKVLLSILTGLLVLLASWVHQNYDFSFSVEDAFLKKVFLWKDKIYSSPSRHEVEVLFINTGKDLALVEDSIDYGKVAISDREKIYQFIHYTNTTVAKPLFTVIDLQFYYPYTINPIVDSLLSRELQANNRMVIPLVKEPDGNYKTPLYKGRYAYSDYRTYGAVFNKFRILNQSKTPSIPIVMDEIINNAVYEDHFIYSTRNGRLCLSAIWPSYYLKNDDVMANTTQLLHPGEIDNKTAGYEKKVKNIKAEYYNIGEILLDIEGSPEKYNHFLKNKIIFIGNFQEDNHVTPIGKISGPILLADIYISLLNRQHIVSIWFFLALLIIFSFISYVALYKKMPELRFRSRFVFSSYIIKFIKKYISYFGCMFLLSILVLIIFNVQVGLFLPSFIFTGIEYIRQKKYKNQGE